MPAFCGIVSHRSSITSSAVSFFIVKLYVSFRPSRGCGGFAPSLFIFGFGVGLCLCLVVRDPSFKLIIF